jgi:hypothetical protein
MVDSAFAMSKADIVIDDNEVLSTLIAEKNGKPRISIFRTGLSSHLSKKMTNKYRLILVKKR